MNDEFKKVCICGALAIVVYNSTPLCKNCLFEKYTDLPSENRPLTIYFSNQIVASISGTATTATISNVLQIVQSTSK